MLCEAVCGIEVELEGSKIKAVRGDREDPFSQGHICPKVSALIDLAQDPDRVTTAMMRRGSDWESADWDHAITTAAEKIVATQQQYGPRAVAVYLGNPMAHSYTGLLASQALGLAIAGAQHYSATSIDQLPHMLAALEMFGHQLMMPVPDIDRTDYFLMLGANPMASNGSIMTAGAITKRIDALIARGAKLVVLDPRRTETAEKASEYIAIRPGSDSFFLLAVLHVLFAEKLTNLRALAPYVDQLAVLEATVHSWTPERVAERTGIDAERIRSIARDFAKAERAVCYGRVGLCTQEFGGLGAWLVNAINIVTGNLDRAGGMMFTDPAADLLPVAVALGKQGHFAKFRSRVRGLPEFGGELPAVTLAEEIDTPGKGQIRALITIAGNPVLSVPDGQRLDRALKTLDFMLSVDIYCNETTRHAHVLLPTTAGLERAHYDLALYNYAVRNTARYASPIIDGPPGVKSDWDTLFQLARAIYRVRGTLKDRALEAAVHATQKLGPEHALDALLRTSSYGAARGGKVSLRALKDNPHGLDLGPLRSKLPRGLWTENKRVQLAPSVFLQDIPRAEKALQHATEHSSELVLIGRRHVRSNNSWMHNSLRLVKGPDRCTLMMHPTDAQKRGLDTGDTVKLASVRGEVHAKVQLTDAMAKGVVSLPHGWGHHREGTQLTVAQAHAGVSINDVTDGYFVDALTGTAALNGVTVTVEKVLHTD